MSLIFCCSKAKKNKVVVVAASVVAYCLSVGGCSGGPSSYFLGRPRDKCRRLINSASSTIQKLPKSSSYRTKHLCRDRLVRMAFCEGATKQKQRRKKTGKLEDKDRAVGEDMERWCKLNNAKDNVGVKN